MNYFEYHGSAFYDDERLNMLKNATFCQDIMKITMYELTTDGKFISKEITNSWYFVYENKLYSFWSDMYGRINSINELNTSIGKCLAGKHGCYYEFEYI